MMKVFKYSISRRIQRWVLLLLFSEEYLKALRSAVDSQCREYVKGSYSATGKVTPNCINEIRKLKYWTIVLQQKQKKNG